MNGILGLIHMGAVTLKGFSSCTNTATGLNLTGVWVHVYGPKYRQSAFGARRRKGNLDSGGDAIYWNQSRLAPPLQEP